MDLPQETPPDRLWHYTSGSAARSIFKSKTLWAGHLGYMNDASEIGHAMKVSREVARSLLDELPQYEEVLERWVRYASDTMDSSKPYVFAVSFSEERDLLSQWRGYAKGSGGPFSLGLPSRVLRRQNLREDGRYWSLRKCIYQREEQMALIERLIRSGLDRAANAEVLPRNRSRAEYAYIQVFSAVLKAAPLCKHPGFSEEREWRLIFGPSSVRKVERVHFVERRHTLAPYIEFALTDQPNEPLGDVHWIAGPGPEQERANQALGMVAQIERMTGYTGSPSQTPFLP